MPDDARLPPRPVAAQQSRCRTSEVHTLLDGVAGPGPLRRHLPRLGRQQHRLVGRRRDQVLPGRRRGVADDLRHRHRGLLRRRLELRASRRDSTASSRRRISGCRRSSCPTASRGHSSGSGCTAGTSWTRSASTGPARDHPGARLAVTGRRQAAYLPLADDIASTAFWYQTEPHAPFPALPDSNGLETV